MRSFVIPIVYNLNYHKLLCTLRRSLKEADSSTATDDVSSESTVFLMQEQVDCLCETDAGTLNSLKLLLSSLLCNAVPYFHITRTKNSHTFIQSLRGIAYVHKKFLKWPK